VTIAKATHHMWIEDPQACGTAVIDFEQTLIAAGISSLGIICTCLLRRKIAIAVTTCGPMASSFWSLTPLSPNSKSRGPCQTPRWFLLVWTSASGKKYFAQSWRVWGGNSALGDRRTFTPSRKNAPETIVTTWEEKL
jgi:hypothetical protein